MAHNNNSASYENVLLCVLFLTFGFVFFDRLAPVSYTHLRAHET